MDKIKIGFITIGQSPRKDLIPEIKPFLLTHIEIVEYGLLNHMRNEEIENMSPEADEIPLVTRLRNGSQVQLGEKKIGELLPKAIDLMKINMDVNAVAALCTHDFPKIKSACPTIFPYDYLQFLINCILEPRKLGVVIPLENQFEMAKKKWGSDRTIVEVKSPYAEDKTWEKIAENFAQKEAGAILLDCIGYKLKDRQAIQRSIKIPTLLPRTILAFAINQLF
ncbi:MAG: AroM family protein [Candidatus Aminicenantes bacterium]